MTFFQSVFKLYYWLISPLLGSRCRFAPSCSEYAHQALAEHGALKGLWLTLARLGRCHPWGGSGLDAVPPKNSAKEYSPKQELRYSTKRCCSKLNAASDNQMNNQYEL